MTEKNPFQNKWQGAGRQSAPSVFEKKSCRMLCLDLDGTLLTDEKTISKNNRRAVRAAYDRGLSIVLATGRQYRKAKEFAGMLDVPVTVIGNNGTSIRNPADDRRLHLNVMPDGLLREILTLSDGFGIAPIVHVDRYEEGTDIVIPHSLSGEIKERYGLMESPWVHSTGRWTPEITRNAVSAVFFGSKKELHAWQDRLTGELKHPYVLHMMENLQKFEAMLEILGETGTKWHGIRLQAEGEGICPEEIMAIGDDSNDLQMLAQAGYSYAPKNATAAVKRAAGRVLSLTNNEDAVAEAIYEVIA